MKRILAVFLILLNVVMLTGCNYPKESNMEYIVSALAIDNIYGSIELSAEIIAVNAEQKSENTNRIILSGKGQNLKKAFYELHKRLSKPLFLNHCATIVISDNFKRSDIKEILNYLSENKDITKSIRILSSENAKELISLKPVTSISMGYELPTALSQWKLYKENEFKNNFFQVMQKILEGQENILLPHFKTYKDGYIIDSVFNLR